MVAAPALIKASYRTKLITTEAELAGVVDAYREFDEFVFDVETKGLHRGDPRRNEVFWISLAGPGRADVIPMGHPLGDIVRWDFPMRKDGKGALKGKKPTPIYGPTPKQLYPGQVFAALEPLLFSKRRKVGHGLKFDIESIAKYLDGRIIPPPYGDTMVGDFLVNENFLGANPYALNSCVQRRFDYTWDKAIRKELEIYPISQAARYSRTDSKMNWLLWQCVRGDIDDEGLTDLFDLEMEVLEAVVDMETTGVHIDEAAVHRLDRELQAQIAEVYDRIRTAAGWDINLNANLQVTKLVYEIRKHKPYMWTEKKQEPSTAAKALERFRHKDPIVDAIITHAELHKLHTTFVEGIIEGLYEGKIQADFDQRGARTGRFSCRKPNLQNIPTRQTKVIRDIFVAPPGHKLIVADYSQIELRLLAHYCQDPLLLKAYTEGLDLHTLTAQRAYHVEVPTEVQRSRAKNVNFSMVYGAGPYTLVEKYGVPTLREAQTLIDTFFSTYRRVDPWRAWVIRRCRKNRITKEQAIERGCRPSPPYVETILGRKRRLPEIMFSDMKRRSGAERQAINTIIQGSAADVQKLATVRCHKAFDGRDMHVILTVHDELVAVVPEEEVDTGVALMVEAMEQVPIDLRVPLKVDVKVVDRWSQGKG